MRFRIQALLPLVAVACAASALPRGARQPQQQPPRQPPQRQAVGRARYRIALQLDFDNRAYSGSARVRWPNGGTRPAAAVYFHLYPNVRGAAAPPDSARAAAAQPNGAAAPPAADDEPRVEVLRVRSADAGTPLQFALDDQATVLRVVPREPVAAGASVEIEIDFKGAVPEIDADETSLSAHVIQQFGAVMRDTREVRRARDINFLSRGVMLLGAAFPLLAVREGDEWRREVRPSVGDLPHADAADYELTIDAPSDVDLYTSGEPRARATAAAQTPPAAVAQPATAAHAQQPAPDPGVRPAPAARAFAGENLRGFAVVAGRRMHSEERAAAGGVRVRSVWLRDHEKTGRRVLDVAARAVEVFTARFGPAPYPAVTVAETPLVAGTGSAEFSGLAAIASAYYLDFDSPAVRNLPEIVREQRSSVEDSLEFAVAHMVAHQWWGGAVGSDPAREPVLDEALAHWSALVYYREAHGAERAEQASEDQLKGVYEIYRTFGGEDLPADREAREYRNSFQYAAVVAAKGALMFSALEEILGAERVFTALRRYHEANRFEIAELDDLRGAFVAEAPLPERRAVTRTFARWLSQRHGDEDIAPPNTQLAAELGLSVERAAGPPGNRFSRLGKFFWRQMTRIR
jgi:Peptidase family M1 domain